MTGPTRGEHMSGPGATVAPPRWVTLGLPLALTALVVLAVVVFLAVGDPTDPGPRLTTTDANPVPSAELTGEWSGTGTVRRCAGFDRCDGTRTITLSIDCSGKRCRVVPFDPRYGKPPLRFGDGHYRAAGPLPVEVSPTCGGTPISTGLWRLDLTVEAGRLTGSYAESTVQSFDCGATGLAWHVTLERR
jgi:hypothetical protein